MAVGVGGRIPIRHPGRCEMGKWDKLSRRGVQGKGAPMLLFGEGLLSSAIIVEEQKNSGEIKTGPFLEREAAFSRGAWRGICLTCSAIWLSELFPAVIKSHCRAGAAPFGGFFGRRRQRSRLKRRLLS